MKLERLLDKEHVKKKPSRKGIPNKVQKPIGFDEIYKKSQENAVPPFKMERSRFKRIWKALAEEAKREIVEESGELELFYRLGVLRVVKTAYKGAMGSRINVKKTLELGFPVYDDSEYYVRISWRNQIHRVKVRNRKLYNFIPERKMERKVRYLFKNKLKDYFE